MEYFVYLSEVGMERVAIEHEEKGNHLKKEPVPYCVKFKESVQ
jgi:hypothetical protein